MPQLPLSEWFERLCRYARSMYCGYRRHYESTVTGQPCNFGDHRIPHWDGGRDRRSVYHKPVWPRIVKNCLKHGISIELYISFVFRELERAATYPNVVASERTVQRCKEMLPKFLNSYRERFLQQLEYLHSRMKFVAQVRRISDREAAWLVYPSRDDGFTPLVAWYAAWKARDKELADLLWPRAVRQLAYDSLWQYVIDLPERLVREAARMRERVLLQTGKDD